MGERHRLAMQRARGRARLVALPCLANAVNGPATAAQELVELLRRPGDLDATMVGGRRDVQPTDDLGRLLLNRVKHSTTVGAFEERRDDVDPRRRVEAVEQGPEQWLLPGARHAVCGSAGFGNRGEQLAQRLPMVGVRRRDLLGEARDERSQAGRPRVGVAANEILDDEQLEVSRPRRRREVGRRDYGAHVLAVVEQHQLGVEGSRSHVDWPRAVQQLGSLALGKMVVEHADVAALHRGVGRVEIGAWRAGLPVKGEAVGKQRREELGFEKAWIEAVRAEVRAVRIHVRGEHVAQAGQASHPGCAIASSRSW